MPPCWRSSYQTNGRFTDARRVLDFSCHYQPDEVKNTLGLADVLIQQQKQTEARKLLLPLTKRGTPANRAKALFYLARSHYRTDELEKALGHLAAAEKADAPTVSTARAYQLKGQILEELGRPSDAVQAFKQALDRDAEASFPLDALVRLMLADNKPAEALAYLRRYVLVVGDDISGQLLAAEHFLKLKHYEDALELATRVREQRFHEKAHRILGLVWLQRGDFARAFEHLDKATPDATVLEGLMRAGLALGRLDDVAGRLDQAARVDLSTVELKKQMERARLLLERRAELLKDAPSPAGQDGLRAELLACVACAEEAAAEGRWADAERLERLTRDRGLELGPAVGLHARLELEHGKLTRALTAADRAIALSPRQANGYFVRGKVRLERGQLGGAGRPGESRRVEPAHGRRHPARAGVCPGASGTNGRCPGRAACGAEDQTGG